MAKSEKTTTPPEAPPPPREEVPPVPQMSRALTDPIGLSQEYILAASHLLRGQSGRTLQPASAKDVQRLLHLALQLVS